MKEFSAIFDHRMSTDHIVEIFGNRLRLRVSGLLADENGILLIKHRFPGERNLLYAPPGGGMQFGEHAHQALQREFMEETGLHVKVNHLQFVYEFLQKPLHAVELFFNVSDATNALQVGLDPELNEAEQIIRDVGWISWKELKNLNPNYLHGSLLGIDSLKELHKLSGYMTGK